MSARSFRRARERQAEREERRRSRLAKRAAASAGLAVGATVLFAPGAQAATFTVNTLADSDDGSCFDDDCSLREAADEANASADADTITFLSGLSGTIELTNNDIPINAATTITGPGANALAVSGLDATQIFDIDPNVVGNIADAVSISGLTLTHGRNVGVGGAVESDNATLTFDGMAFVDNEATSAGGALHSDTGNLFVSNTVFSGNHAAGWGGALYLEDTANTPADDVEFRVSGSSFINNDTDASGGGLDIDNPHGDSVVENTTFRGNHADSTGGGITVNETLEEDADVIVRNSTLVDNTANDGAAFYSEDVDGTTLIENTTITGNRANYNGGGVYFGYLYDDETTLIRNSTITNNVAGVDPSDSGDYAGGGVYLRQSGTPPPANGPVRISSTIIAGNAADIGPDLGQDDDSDGFVVGFSLIGNPAGADIAEDPAGSNLSGVDPQLGPLASNGGPTETQLPALTSPAIDAGVANGLATDQRGFARTAEISSVPNRPGSDGTDIGAVEIQSAECQGAFVPSKVGTDNGETIDGTAGPDAISALGGNDTVNALAGNDCAFGGAGDDLLGGDEDNDLLSGDDGNDTANGDDGNDNVSGGDGKDKGFGGAGKDKVSGGAGKDRLKGNGGKDKVKGNAGKDTLNGDGGKDKVTGAAGKDRIKGGNGKDKIKGNGGKDKINSIDDTKDRVNCGGGKDKAKVDAIDRVSKNCEVVKVKGA